MPIVTKKQTLKNVQESKSKTVYYSSRTVWWTDDPADLQGSGLPLDIFGAPLYEAPKDPFLKAALSKPDHYGKNGIETFMATHHKNFTAVKGESPQEVYTNFIHFDESITQIKSQLPEFTLLK